MKRRKIAMALATVLLFLSLATEGMAYTIAGGTEAQRVDVVATLEAAQFPPVAWVESQAGPVRIEIGPGASWSLPGYIHVNGTTEPGPGSYFREIVAHEWGHRVYAALPQEAQDEWAALATADFPAYDRSIWLQKPGENFTENLRVAAWTSEYYQTPEACTNLKRFDMSFMRVWLEKWILLYSDIPRADTELRQATWYAQGIFRGYDDGTFRPYAPLTRRQVALVADRWKGFALTAFLNDWSPATRADVRDAMPGLVWQEERWGEGITRSQMLRLMYRAR